MSNPIAYFEFPADQLADLSHNHERFTDAMRCFAEVECGDPRLIVIVAAARIEIAVLESLELYAHDIERMPNKFHSRMNQAKQRGIIDASFSKYASAIRKLRNIIAHQPTQLGSLKHGECQTLLRLAFNHMSSVPIWGETVDPDDDLVRSVFAICLAGVLAAEMDFFDDRGSLIPKGFNALREWAAGIEQPHVDD